MRQVWRTAKGWFVVRHEKRRTANAIYRAIICRAAFVVRVGKGHVSNSDAPSLNFVRHGSRANKFLDDVLTSRRISNGAKVGGVLLLHRCAVHSNWSLRRRTCQGTCIQHYCARTCAGASTRTHTLYKWLKLKICNN